MSHLDLQISDLDLQISDLDLQESAFLKTPVCKTLVSLVLRVAPANAIVPAGGNTDCNHSRIDQLQIRQEQISRCPVHQSSIGEVLVQGCLKLEMAFNLFAFQDF